MMKDFDVFHTGYLKLCQLQKPRSLFAEHCDVLLVDEAQDLSPGILALSSSSHTGLHAPYICDVL